MKTSCVLHISISVILAWQASDMFPAKMIGHFRKRQKPRDKFEGADLNNHTTVLGAPWHVSFHLCVLHYNAFAEVENALCFQACSPPFEVTSRGSTVSQAGLWWNHERYDRYLVSGIVSCN